MHCSWKNYTWNQFPFGTITTNKKSLLIWSWLDVNLVTRCSLVWCFTIQGDPDGLALIPRQLLCTHFARHEKQSHNNCFSLWIIHINHSVERSHHHSKQKYEWIFLFDHFFNLRVFSFFPTIYVVLLPLPCFVLLNI